MAKAGNVVAWEHILIVEGDKMPRLAYQKKHPFGVKGRDHGGDVESRALVLATDYEALRKRCEAVEADAAMVQSLRFAASRWKHESDYHASGIADDYGAGQRHAFLSCATEMLAIIDQAIAAAQEPSHG